MELFKLLGTVAIDCSDAEGALDEVAGNAEKSQSRIGSAFDKIGTAAVKVGKAMAAGLAVGSAAVGALAKSALEGYADYEQLVGGVETLFGSGGQTLEEYAESVGKTVDEVRDEYNGLQKAQKTVLGNAEQAYKNAGMSANEYMETVTSFSAALIQSLNGNKEAAAEKANQAIIDMADNANKMGSSMESIQNAYQGFAKGNMTMLDNLKLGYGGTQEEMQRLLEDAQAISGIKYDVSSYADIVDAIHVIQEEMGIAGTTAKEASETISGSVDSAKSAWANLITGIADEGANLPVLVNNFVDSAITAVGNIVPRLQIILEQIGQLAGDIFVKAFDYVSVEILKTETTFETVSTKAKTALSAIWQSVKDGFAVVQPTIENAVGKVKELTKKVTDAASEIFEKFSSEFGNVKEMFGELSENVIAPFVETHLNNLIAKFEAVVEVFETMVLPILEMLIDAWFTVAQSVYEEVMPSIQVIMDKFNELSGLVQQVVNEYIIPTIQSFVAMIKQLYEENKDKLELIGELYGVIFEKISNKVSEFVTWFKGTFIPFLEEIRNFVQENMDKIKEIFQNAIDFLTGIIEVFIAFFKGDWEGLWTAVVETLQAGCDCINNIFSLLEEYLRGIFEKIVENVKEKFEEIRDKIEEKITEAKEKVKEIFEDIKETISEKISDAKEKVVSVFETISSTIEEKINAAKDAVSNAIEAIKGFFNFEVKLPDIKLPHFGISPAGWQIGDLLDGVIPELGIEWYAKGGVMEEPTAFGVNGNRLMVGGEAGPEAIAPIDVLQEYIAQAVAAQNTALVAVLQQILDAILSMNESMGDNMREALDGIAVALNEREFGRLVRAVN